MSNPINLVKSKSDIPRSQCKRNALNELSYEQEQEDSVNSDNTEHDDNNQSEHDELVNRVVLDNTVLSDDEYDNDTVDSDDEFIDGHNSIDGNKFKSVSDDKITASHERELYHTSTLLTRHGIDINDDTGNIITNTHTAVNTIQHNNHTHINDEVLKQRQIESDERAARIAELMNRADSTAIESFTLNDAIDMENKLTTQSYVNLHDIDNDDDNKVNDNWLNTVNDVEKTTDDKRNKRVRYTSSTNTTTTVEPYNELYYRQQIIQYMNEGDTVAHTIQRLGESLNQSHHTTKPKPWQKQARLKHQLMSNTTTSNDKTTMTDQQKQANQMIDTITHAADTLLYHDIVDIYSETRNDIQQRIHKLQSDDIDMNTIEWVYKTSIESSENFGPFSSNDMTQWKSAGYFSDEHMVCKVLGDTQWHNIHSINNFNILLPGQQTNHDDSKSHKHVNFKF